jgi:N-acetylmuramoyl-L-alanine amidase
MAPGQARMVLVAIGPVELEIARVDEASEGDGYRLVLDAVATSNSRFAELTDERGWLASTPQAEGERVVSNSEGGDKPFTVVLDPGHGGIDPGAQGQAGTLEKDVTLAFAKEIAEQLSEYDDIRVILTREDDRFISLAGRVRIARQHEADVMMSVHADSIRLPDIRGATVYTVSDNASDRMAADLARRENRADEAAGITFTETSDEVVDILMDLTRRETSVFSVGLARSVLDRLRGEIRLIGNAHRHAGFRVLTAPDVPSLLVELGYLSNKEDEELLTDPKWREKTATLLAEAIHGFRMRMFAQAKEL